MGEGRNDVQVVIGVCNFLLWPISIVWGIPQAAVDANRQNIMDMVYYYQYDNDGKKEIEKIDLDSLPEREDVDEPSSKKRKHHQP